MSEHLDHQSVAPAGFGQPAPYITTHELSCLVPFQTACQADILSVWLCNEVAVVVVQGSAGGLVHPGIT